MAAAASELRVLEPVADGRLYPVRSGANTYYVDVSCGECDCPAFWFQSPENRKLCKHSKAVARHLMEAAACPVCGGKAELTPCGLVTYVTPDGRADEGPWPCVTCGGSGRREVLG